MNEVGILRAQAQLQSRNEHNTLSVDSTLSLLYASSISRGTAHDVIKNISFLFHTSVQAVLATPTPKWDAQKPLSAYTPHVPKKGMSKSEKDGKRGFIEARGWSALGEVMWMAEGSAGIHLGRLGSPGSRKSRRNEIV